MSGTYLGKCTDYSCPHINAFGGCGLTACIKPATAVAAAATYQTVTVSAGSPMVMKCPHCGLPIPLDAVEYVVKI